jgi:nucleotide-binding universal stress UspA family protein
VLGDAALRLGAPATSAYTSEDAERLREASEQAARSVLAGALERVGCEAIDAIEVEQEIVEGPTVPVLIGAARAASLLVLGSRGRGGFAGLLLGSVSQQCAQHPPCPVVILPPVEEDAPGGNG